MRTHLNRAKECAVADEGGLNISRQILSIEIDKKGECPCKNNCGVFLKNDKIRIRHESKCAHVDTIPVVPRTHVSEIGS